MWDDTVSVQDAQSFQYDVTLAVAENKSVSWLVTVAVSDSVSFLWEVANLDPVSNSALIKWGVALPADESSADLIPNGAFSHLTPKSGDAILMRIN